jgi:gliding motility-associated-like protein
MKRIVFLLIIYFNGICLFAYNADKLMVVKNLYTDTLKQTQLFKPQDDPIAHFTTVTKACVYDTVRFKNESVGEYTNVLWNFGDGIDAAAWNSPFHIYDSAGVYTVKLTVIKAGVSGKPAVVDSTKLQIIIVAAPALEIIHEDTVIYEGYTTTLTAIGHFKSILWDNGKITESIQVSKSGYYSVTVKDTVGCRNMKTSPYIKVITGDENDTLRIKVINNILTPNNDGINDALLIKDMGRYSNPIVVVIYNIWGNKIFETNDYAATGVWEGTNVDAGTYYYSIRSNGRKGLTGYIDVIK